VDSSADMLERCRSNAADLGLDVTLYHQKMEELSLPRRYRSIYLAGPTFNLLPDDKTALGALRAIERHLADEGTALIPLWIPAPTAPDDLGATREATGQDGVRLRYTAVSEVYDEAARIRTTFTRYERVTSLDSECVERAWTIHWFSREQFRDMCAEAGLWVTRVVDMSRDEFTVTVQRQPRDEAPAPHTDRIDGHLPSQ
jgi:hypothetical protein